MAKKELDEYLGIYKWANDRTDIELVVARSDEEAEAQLRALSDLEEDTYELRIYKRVQ